MYTETEVTKVEELQRYPFPTLADYPNGIKVTDDQGVEHPVVECEGMAWDKYLAQFLLPRHRPGRGTYCVSCGHLFTGTDMVQAMLMGASFTWGIRHGSGQCSVCGYPARVYHFVKLASGAETRLVFVVQYHPDALKRP